MMCPLIGNINELEQMPSPRANIQSLVENEDKFLDVEQLNGWRLHLLLFTSLSETAPVSVLSLSHAFPIQMSKYHHKMTL